MADPATITLAVKAAVAVATDERTWKVVGMIVAAILTPLILIIICLMSLLSGTSSHNNAAVDLSFNGGIVDSQMPQEYRQYICDMQNSFESLDGAITEINSICESDSLDSIRVKAVFYALYFGQDSLRSVDYRNFVDSFVRYEERTRTWTDDDGTEHSETYTVAIPLSLPEVYSNLSMTAEQIANSSAIYSLVLYGYATPDSDNISYDDWQLGIDEVPHIFVGDGNFASPLGANWRSMVTSEFGWRRDPFGGSGGEGHSGLDMGAAKGTPIQAARDGIVSYVKNSGSAGYGYHLVIDHGDGMVTVYAHCSAVYAKAGQQVTQGDVIAAVGSTGRSTGNHLHFEVRINGKKVNPRQYLP